MNISKATNPIAPTADSSHHHYYDFFARFLARLLARLLERPHLIWAVLIAFALRLVVVAFVYQDFLVPGREHWEFGYELGKISYSIAHGHGFSNPYWVDTGPTAMITPVYPYLMSAVFSVFGAYTKAAALTVLGFNSLVSALTCIPIFFLARNGFGLRTAIVAVWGWAFFPYAVYFSASSMWYHSLVALLLTLLLLIASYLETRSRLWMWAGFGVLWGVAALITPVVLAVVPFLGGWVCYRLYRNRESWKLPAATALFALFVTVAPWMVRNILVFHRPVFLKDNFWMEVCVGNLGNDRHWWADATHPAANPAELDAFRKLGELGYMARERRQALDFIQSHPGIYVWRSLRRVVYMWTGFWSLDPEYLRGEPFDLANIGFATALTILAMTGLYKALGSSRNTVMPYVLTLLTFPLAYYLTHSEISYRQPIDPELVILASVAVVSWRKPVLKIPGFGKRKEVMADARSMNPDAV
ncbi:MAG: glycosyltransferase family 39 protein [Terriglobales bacterium]